MSLVPGDRLGPYEVLAPLGAGGMGEVYRARDTRLSREVALKVLPRAVAGDVDRLRRFEQEARAAGQLDHPNLLTVFDVGTHDGAPYLVCELLRGETLRERLAGGPLPRERALDVAGQLARGLAAAHDKGIVHRDLKPENLFLTRDGRAKILDFGLARVAPERTPPGGPSEAETESALTAPGVVVGTAGYMSPEQVRGEPVDTRSDLFSFGAVLYEMLTGRRAFAGSSAVETMSAVLREDPAGGRPPSELGGDALARVLQRCLEKRREDRFRSASDLAFALALASGAGTPSGSGAAAVDAAPPRARHVSAWRALPWAVAAGALLLAAALAWRQARALLAPAPAPPSSITDATLTPLTVDPGDEIDPSFAPDGETLAYASDRSGDYEIYLQKTSGGPALNLTKDAGDDVQPAFSPDGKWIAFVSTRQSRTGLAYRAPRLRLMGGDLWLMPAFGGPPHRIADDANFPAWSPDGRFVYYTSGPWFRSEVRRVEATGGAVTSVPIRFPVGLPVPFLHSPSVSPDGRWIAICVSSRVFVVASSGGEARPLAVGSFAAFSARGPSLVFANAEPGRNHSVWRLPFDTRQGTAAGPPAALTLGTAESTSIAASPDGTRLAIALVDRAVNVAAMPFDADGAGVRGSPVELTRGNQQTVFLCASPDGRAVVFQSDLGSQSRLWRVDGPGTEPFQLTRDPEYDDSFPRWSPDGTTISFSRQRHGTAPTDGTAARELWLMAADGASQRPTGVRPGQRSAWLDPQRLVAFRTDPRGYVLIEIASRRVAPVLENAYAMPIFDVSQDGRWLAGQSNEHESVDVLAVRMDGQEKPRYVVSTPDEDYHPFFSPQGRWLYYQQGHTNLFRVPGPAQGWRRAPPEQVTRFPVRESYIEEPQISRDGRTLVYAHARIAGDVWLLGLR